MCLKDQDCKTLFQRSCTGCALQDGCGYGKHKCRHLFAYGELVYELHARYMSGARPCVASVLVARSSQLPLAAHDGDRGGAHTMQDDFVIGDRVVYDMLSLAVTATHTTLH